MPLSSSEFAEGTYDTICRKTDVVSKGSLSNFKIHCVADILFVNKLVSITSLNL